MPRIDAFLKLGLAQGCSDVHLAVGVPPMLRMRGDLMPIKFRNLADTELDSYIQEILTQTQRTRFSGGNDLDFSYVSEEGGRFRVNLFRKATGVGATFRYIPNEIPSFEKLGLPAIVQKLNAELNEYLRQDQVRELLAKQGLEAVNGPPERFGQLIAREIPRWKRVVAAAGIKPE